MSGRFIRLESCWFVSGLDRCYTVAILDPMNTANTEYGVSKGGIYVWKGRAKGATTATVTAVLPGTFPLVEYKLSDGARCVAALRAFVAQFAAVGHIARGAA